MQSASKHSAEREAVRRGNAAGPALAISGLLPLPGSPRLTTAKNTATVVSAKTWVYPASIPL